MKKTLALILALVMVFSLVACGQQAAAPAADEAATSSIAVCLASEPDTIDPALNSAVDGATLLIHLFSGLSKWEKDANGALKIVPDAAEELVDGVEKGNIRTWSVEGYLNEMRTGSGYSDAAKALMNAIVIYGDSATAYLLEQSN